MSMRVFTIGFTKKNARRFFTLLQEAGVRTLLDVRLNNRSQLAGFSKAGDLEYFLMEIGDIGYRHLSSLAPTQDILDAYKKGKGSWAEYEGAFNDLLRARAVEDEFTPDDFDHACLLCSEHEPDHCHRRLVVEYLQAAWGNIETHHLM